MAQRPAFKQVSGGYRVAADHSIWRWLAGRLKEWWHLKHGGIQARLATGSLLVKIRRYAPPFKQPPNEWHAWKNLANRLGSGTSGDDVQQAAAFLEGVAGRAEAQARRAREKAYQAWVSDVTGPAIRLGFRCIKEQPPWAQPKANSHRGVADP